MDALQFTQLLSEAFDAALKPRISRILHLRLGIADGQPRTLEEIAEEMGVSRERVRQLINKGLKALPLVCMRECRTTADGAPTRLLVYVWLSLRVDDEQPVRRIRQFAEEHLPTVPFENHALPLLASLIFKKPSLAARFVEWARDVYREQRQERKRKRGEEYRRRRHERLKARVQPRFEYLQTYTIRPPNLPDLKRLAVIRRQREVSETSTAISGEFSSAKLQRSVQFESNTERRFFEWLEVLDDVEWYCEQPMVIPYICSYTDKTRAYYPDLLFTTRDGRATVVEIKPVLEMALRRNLDKWRAARRHLAALGIGFLVTDGRIGVQELMRHSVPADYRRAVLDAIGPAGLNWADYSRIVSIHSPKTRDFVALALQEKLWWSLAPFDLRFPPGDTVAVTAMV